MLKALKQLIQGQDQAPRASFEREILEHLDGLYGMAMRLTRDAAEAEDLVQDTYVRALRFYKRYEPGSNLKAWLFKILTNTFYNRVRKSNNIRKLEQEADSGDHYDRFISAASAGNSTPEQLLLDGLIGEKLSEAIDELSDDFRVAVLLSDVYELSYKEISEAMGCPVGTVMSRLYRGRRQLQKKLYHYAVERGVVAEDANQPADLNAYRARRKAENGGAK